MLEPLLAELVRYTQEHFAAEERLMLLHKFPGYTEHKQEHEAFVAKVLDFQKQYEKGGVSLSLDVMEFLVEWVRNHIKGVDHRYGPYLRERGVV